jgi:uncharacterized protein DUF3307
MTKTWTSRFADLIVAHAVGDFILQSDWEARNKPGGLGTDPTSRRALGSHVAVYTLACSGVLVGVARSRGVPAAALAAAAIALPHAIVDDRGLLRLWLRDVKGLDVDETPPSLEFLVDQSMHLVCLWALARALGDD